MPARPGAGGDAHRRRRRRPPAVGFVVFTLVIDALGFGLVVPIVPLLVERLSRFDRVARLAVGRPVAGLLRHHAVRRRADPGRALDRFGRRPVLLLSLAGVGVNYLLLAWAPSLAWLMLGRCIAGATSANASTATAYIADVTPPAQRAARFGLVGASFGLGFVIGPALGGLLGTYGLRVPFLAAGAMAGLNLLYGVFVLPESLPPRLRRPFDWRRANPCGSLLVLAATAPWGGWRFPGAAPGSRWARCRPVSCWRNQIRFGWGTQQNGLALALAGLGSAVVQGLLVRKIIPALGEWRAALTGSALTVVAYLLIAFAPYGWVVLLGIVVQACGAFTNPAVQGMVSAERGAGPAGRDPRRTVLGAGSDGDRLTVGGGHGVRRVHRARRVGAAAGGAVHHVVAGVLRVAVGDFRRERAEGAGSRGSGAGAVAGWCRQRQFRNESVGADCPDSRESLCETVPGGCRFGDSGVQGSHPRDAVACRPGINWLRYGGRSRSPSVWRTDQVRNV